MTDLFVTQCSLGEPNSILVSLGEAQSMGVGI